MFTFRELTRYDFFLSQKQNCDDQDIMIEGSPEAPETSLDLTSTARFDLSPAEKEQGSIPILAENSYPLKNALFGLIKIRINPKQHKHTSLPGQGPFYCFEHFHTCSSIENSLRNYLRQFRK